MIRLQTLRRALALGVVAASAAASSIATAQDEPRIPLDVVLDSPAQLAPDLPRVAWIPGGAAFAAFADRGEGEEAEQVIHRVPVDGGPASVLTTAGAVYAALAAGGSDAKPGKRPPPLRFLDPATLRLETPDAVWRWRIGDDAAERVLPKIRDASRSALAPDDRAGAFVVEHDLVIQRRDGDPHRVTSDGSPDIVYGGGAHRQEFGIRSGLFWDPTGRFLAFSREDLRPIEPYPYIDYTKSPPVPIHGRYPMAGRVHSKVTIWILDLRDDSLRVLEHDPAADLYWTNVTFAPDGLAVYVALVDRGQDRMDLVEFDARTGARGRTLLTERDPEWIEPDHGPVFTPDGGSFLWLSPRDGFDHLYRYARDGRLIGQVTDGDFDLEEFAGFSADGARGYAFATGPDPLTRHLWSFALDGDAPARDMVPLTTEPGQHACQIDTKSGNVLDAWSSIEMPGRLDLLRPDGTARTLFVAEDPYAAYAVGRQELFTVRADDGTPLYGHAIYPPGLDPEHPDAGRTYPVLLYVYAGPQSQLVRNEWNGGASLWLHHLASQGAIVVRLDGRGTNNRGIEFAQSVYRRLGTLEVRDQLRALDWIASKPFVDPARIGVHGWSYGGYMTLRLMLLAPDRFRCGIAGAPVTDWTRYETGYTERYMDTPAENPDGYEASSCLPLAKNLEGRLLLVHGTNDQTVMYSHAMAFIEACIQADVPLDFMAYPMQLHGVSGQHRKHLYRKMTRFLRENLAF